MSGKMAFCLVGWWDCVAVVLLVVMWVIEMVVLRMIVLECEMVAM